MMTLKNVIVLSLALLLAVWTKREIGPLYLATPQASSTGQDRTGTPDLIPEFEVAVVKPGKFEDRMVEFSYLPDGIRFRGITVQMLLREAFDIEKDRFVNLPNWASKDRYDIQAKVSEEDILRYQQLKFAQRKEMLQRILKDRFNLVIHRETRELPLFVLSVAKGGVKFKSSATEQDEPDPSGKHTLPRLQVQGTHLESEGAPIQSLVHILSQDLGSSIIDNTVLDGRYDYTLDWARDPDSLPSDLASESHPTIALEASHPNDGPTIFTALQEQLGLKLEKRKAPVFVIVIDRIEKPSAN